MPAFTLTAPPQAQPALGFAVHPSRRKLTVCALCRQVTEGGLPCTPGLVCVRCVAEHGPDKAKGLAALRRQNT